MHNMKKEIEHLKELMNERFLSSDKALDLHSKEVERRLTLLNGEAGRLKEMQSTYLPREIHDANLKELGSKIEWLQKMVYIGIGGILVLQLVLKFIK